MIVEALRDVAADLEELASQETGHVERIVENRIIRALEKVADRLEEDA